MQPLSKQLQDLSDHAKKTEDLVEAARKKDREKLAQQHAAPKAAIAAANTETSNDRDKLSTWWASRRASVDPPGAAPSSYLHLQRR